MEEAVADQEVAEARSAGSASISKRDAACWYARKLGPVFPCYGLSNGACTCGKPDCSSPGKHPRTPRGLLDATNDPDLIANTWRARPDSNIGLRTGGPFFVVDVDQKHDGEATIAALEDRHGTLPPTWECLTGGGGRHFYFRTPAGVTIPSRAAVAVGIDCRGAGGYVLVPPSIGTIREYAWEHQNRPFAIPLADPPAWVVAMVTRGSNCRDGATISARPPDYWRDLVTGGVNEGGRNHAIAQLAGFLLRRIDPFVALDLVLAWNARRCRPPLPENEVVKVCDSIARKEARRRGIV